MGETPQHTADRHVGIPAPDRPPESPEARNMKTEEQRVSVGLSGEAAVALELGQPAA